MSDLFLEAAVTVAMAAVLLLAILFVIDARRQSRRWRKFERDVNSP